MNDAVESVQERMERTAVLNARMLVEKMEQDRRMKIGFRGWVAVTILAIAMVAIVGGGTIYFNQRAAAARAAMRPVASTPKENTAAMSPDEYVQRALRRIERDGNQAANAGWRAGAQGRTVVEIDLGGGGYAKVTTVESSGDKALDSHFMTLVKQAEPYGNLPAGVVKWRFRATLWVDAGDGLVKSAPVGPQAPG